MQLRSADQQSRPLGGFKALPAVSLVALVAFLLSCPIAAVAAGLTVTVKTDLPSYSGAQSLTVSGTVSPTPTSTTYIVIKATSPSGAQVLYNEAQVSTTDGSFSLQFVTGGPNWVAGTYMINATYAPAGAAVSGSKTVSFSYSPSSATTSSTVTSSSGVTTSHTSSTAASTSSTTHSPTSSTESSTTSQATSSSTSTMSTSTTPTPTTTVATTSSSGGIPEFPFQLVIVSLLTVVMVAAYAVARSMAMRRGDSASPVL